MCLLGRATQICHGGVLFLGRPSLGTENQWHSPSLLQQAWLCSHGAGRAATGPSAGNEVSGGAVLLLGDTANTAVHGALILLGSLPALCPYQLLLGDARLQEGGCRRLHLAQRGAGLSSEPRRVGFRQTLRVPPALFCTHVCAVQLAVAS